MNEFMCLHCENKPVVFPEILNVVVIVLKNRTIVLNLLQGGGSTTLRKISV